MKLYFQVTYFHFIGIIPKLFHTSVEINSHFSDMKSGLSSILFIHLVLAVVFEWGIAARAPVIVNKCCSANEMLSENQKCIISGDAKWWPLIVMIMKQTYFEPKGSAPKFMKYREQRPFCKNAEFFIGPHKLALFSNGTLYLSEKHKVINAENYCIDKDTAIVCDPELNSSNIEFHVQKTSKIRKCCVKNSVYNTIQNTCVVDDTLAGPKNQLTLSNSTDFDIVFGFPQCNASKDFTIAEKFVESNLDRNANRLTIRSGRHLDWNEFCIENVITENETYVAVFTCAASLSISSNSDKLSDTDIRFILFPIGLLISVVFLLATLATRYVLSSNHHHMLHWRCQTYHVVCLLIGDLLLAITQLFGRNANSFTCTTVAVSMHFFFLSAFFWLNTMCFNIYISFRDFRPTSLERSQEKFRLRIYKIYAWGVPFLISTIAATMDQMRRNSMTQIAYLQPRFCETEYWFSGNMEKFTYFYGPIGFLLFVNLLLFASTARQLTCGLWKREEVKSTTERTTLGRICIKLVVVMGTTWVADFLSWAHGLWIGEQHYLWIITDLINTLQGVFIFIVIGCQPQVSSAVKQIWRSKNIQFRRENTEGGVRNSSSSQVASSLGESITNNTFTTSNAKISAETVC